MKQGKNFFEKILTTSALPPFSQLTLPAPFVQEHGNNIQEFVTLRNIANKKRWTVKIHISLPNSRPQATFYKGWRAFTTANDIVVGDRLTFVLVAKSLFDVFILSLREKPILSVEMPKLRPHSETKKTLGPQHDRDLSANGSENSNNTKNETVLSEEIEEQKFVAKAPESSRTPSDMASHFFEPIGEQKKVQRVSKPVKETTFEAQDLSTLPYFHKRITKCNNLEIPCSFVKMHSTRLGTSVRLQGVHERSAVYTMDCKSLDDKGRLRIYLRTGWTKFVNDNSLRAGQELIFTLTADSSFIVRKM